MTSSRHHFTHFGIIADITRVDTQAVGTGICHRQSNLIIKMNISDQRHADLFFDLGKGGHTLHRRRGHTHQISTGIDTSLNLCHRRRHITGVGIGHTLYADRCITTDGDIADMDFFGWAAFDWVMC